MSEYTSITGELREYAGNFYLFRYKDVREKLDAIADRIEAEHNLATANEWMRAIKYAHSDEELAKYGLVRLPVDADGEAIHVGDMMEHGKSRGHVIALMLSEYPKKWGGGLHWGVQLEGEQAPTALDAFFHHYHEPTVEDVLGEFVARWMETHPDDIPALKAEYAAKLRLAGE